MGGALLFAACGQNERVGYADGEIAVDTTGIVFPHTELGQLSNHSLSVWHTGRARREISIEMTGEGFEGPPTMELDPGLTPKLTLYFRPKGLGQVHGSATLISNNQSVTITLSGSGIPAER